MIKTLERPVLKRHLTHDVADDLALLSFSSELEAAVFKNWWNQEGWAAFRTWWEKQHPTPTAGLR